MEQLGDSIKVTERRFKNTMAFTKEWNQVNQTSHPVNCEVTLRKLQHIKILYIKNKVSGIKSFMKNDALVLFGVTRTTSIILNKCKDLFICDTTGYY